MEVGGGSGGKHVHGVGGCPWQGVGGAMVGAAGAGESMGGREEAVEEEKVSGL